MPLAERWEKAVTSAALRIAKNPNGGTPCKFESSELRDLRRTTITGFPKHLIFYRFHEEEIFILRVVHGARDLERELDRRGSPMGRLSHISQFRDAGLLTADG